MITTTVIGSMPKPRWLVRDDNIRLWRLGGEALRQGMDDAARLSIRDQEVAGVDVITDGEQRRMHYVSRFISSLSGVDFRNSNLADVAENTADKVPPVVVGDIGRKHAFAVEDLRFLQAHTDRRVKMTLPGPMTLMRPLEDQHYGNEADLAMALAEALHAEISDLEAAGCDVIQLDEPFAIRRPREFAEWGRAAIDRAFEGVEATTCVHFCFGYRDATESPTARDPILLRQFETILPEIGRSRTRQVAVECACSGIEPQLLRQLPEDKQIVYGVIDNACTVVEDPRAIAADLQRAVNALGSDRVWAAPDCGLVWLPIDVAREKLEALVRGAADASGE